MKNCIRYISTNKTVCGDPEMLGHDFVTVDYGDEGSCKTCMALILAHNHREYRKETDRRYDLIVQLPEKPKEPDVSDFFVGVAMASSFWITVFLILWAVYYR